MNDASDDKRGFFVSFNQADRAWATWIAWVLEEAGHSVWFQDWDFRGNFVERMNRAHAQAHRTLAVLSDHYFGSEFTLAEWSARFAQDPAGREDRLVPVKVGPLTGETILGPTLHADLTGCDEAEAKQRLLERVKKAVDPTYRAKRAAWPGFPGGPAREMPERPGFPGPIHNLPPRNPDFVGREKELEELLDLLVAAKPVVLTQAITGLGGIGKTQTALAYAYRQLTGHKLVWWLKAESPATLAADYTAMAEHLGLPEMVEQPKQVAAVRRALEGMEGGWLLVFDNVEEPALVREYLPRTGEGQVLLTSRRIDWRGTARTLPLEVMPEVEALQLLTGRPDPASLPAPDLAEAKALARDLGYLPLALAQAQAYMAETGKDLAGYHRLLRESRPAVLDEGRPSPDYPASVARTWQVSIEAAAEACAAARPLLELLAFFAPEALRVKVLASTVEVLPEGLRGELERDKAVGALNRFSLIRAEADAITVHRLVQAVTCDDLDEATVKVRAALAVRLMNTALPHAAWEHSNWPVIGTDLPHALATAGAARRLGVGLEATSEVLNTAALYHHARAAWAEAERLYQQALEIREKVFGAKHPNTATFINNLASLLQDMGRHAEAEPLFRKALKVLGAKHPNTATLINNLALLLRDMGRHAEAEPLFRKALKIRKRVLGAEHPSTATNLNNLALLLRDKGQYAEAERLYQQALEIREKVFGAEHPDTAISLNNLACLYRAQDRHAEAEPLHQQALEIREKVFGAEHPDTAISLINLALLYEDQGQHAKAEPLFQRALPLAHKVEPFYERILEIREKARGADDPDTARARNDLERIVDYSR